MLFSWKRVVAASLLTAAAWMPTAHADEALSKEQVEGVVRDYLMQNPQFLLEALRNMQAWQEEQNRLQQMAVLSAAKDSFLSDPEVPTYGPDDAKVTVIEFFDYHCGYCKRSFDEVMTMADQAGDIKVVFLEFPILSEESVLAARAALAAKRQGKYMEIHAAFMEARGRLNQERIDEIALGLGLNVPQLKIDMEDPMIARQISHNRALARQLDVSGTPAFIVGDTVVGGANMPMVAELVEQERSKS